MAEIWLGFAHENDLSTRPKGAFPITPRAAMRRCKAV